MSELKDKISLPFNKVKQRAVLGHILTNPSFFLQCRAQIKPNWFSEELLSAKIYKIQCEWFDRHGYAPSVEEVAGCPAVMSEPIPEQTKIRNHIQLCLSEMTKFGLDAIRAELTEWLRAVVFREALETATKAYNRGLFNQVDSIFKETVRRGNDIEFEDHGEVTLNNLQLLIEKTERERGTALTTGLKIFDQALMDGATVGGLQRGDMTLILAPSNVGKTTALITIACHNVRRGKSVLLMTHEGRPDDIARKIHQSFLGMTYPEILAAYKDPKLFAVLQQKLEFLNRFMTYIPINKPGMTVEYVEAKIRRAQEARMAKKGGKGYDLVVSDYPAKLTTEKAAKGNLPRREIDRIVYDYYVQLALEYNFHALTAIQTNRDGSRVNNGREERLLTKEDVSESWGPIELATNVITMNRSPFAKQMGRVTFYVDKSRSSETGTAIVCNSRYDMSLTHSEELGGIWYRGHVTMEDRVDDLLRQFGKDPDFARREIPESLVFAS